LAHAEVKRFWMGRFNELGKFAEGWQSEAYLWVQNLGRGR